MYLKALYLELLGDVFMPILLGGKIPMVSRMCFCNGLKPPGIGASCVFFSRIQDAMTKKNNKNTKPNMQS